MQSRNALSAWHLDSLSSDFEFYRISGRGRSEKAFLLAGILFIGVPIFVTHMIIDD